MSAETFSAFKVTGANVASSEFESCPVYQDRPSTSAITDPKSKGWALKTTKKQSRMEGHVKAYLVQKFDAGVILTGLLKNNPVNSPSAAAANMSTIIDISL